MTEPVIPFQSFREFYPFYLSQHRTRGCRRLHFVGTASVLLALAYVGATASWSILWLLPLLGYGFAWAGHFFFEKNRPATFRYPLYSLIGDFVMFGQVLRGKLTF